jgi:hypothetical protein
MHFPPPSFAHYRQEYPSHRRNLWLIKNSRQAELLYRKLDEDARQLVSERVGVEVTAVVNKVEHMAEKMMIDLSEKYARLQTGLEGITQVHEDKMEGKVQQMSRAIKERIVELDKVHGDHKDNFDELKRQGRASATSLAKSVDMLQVRYEGCAAEVERVAAKLREQRSDIQSQHVLTEQMRQQLDSHISDEVGQLKSKLQKLVKATEEGSAVELEAAMKAVVRIPLGTTRSEPPLRLVGFLGCATGGQGGGALPGALPLGRRPRTAHPAGGAAAGPEPGEGAREPRDDATRRPGCRCRGCREPAAAGPFCVPLHTRYFPLG